LRFIYLNVEFIVDLKDIICQKVYDAGGGMNGDDWITKDEAKSFRMRGLVYSELIIYDNEVRKI
jgi:hypothetical protein